MNQEAFHDRILPVQNKLFRFALQFLKDEDEAKDVVQEVMLRVWTGGDRMNEVQNWEAWCMRIARNLSLDRLRLIKKDSRAPMEDDLRKVQHAEDPYARTERNESMKTIDDLISGLPEKQRQIIHLRDIEGYSYKEIADILELDMNQVKVNLFRARNAVRERLTKLNAYGV